MSMALKYGLMKKAKKMGDCPGESCPGCPMCKGGMLADGGFVEEEEASGYQPMPEPEAENDEGEEGIVDRIMKRFANGGMVKEEEPVADFESNDFDVMDMKPEPSEADYTGANSGDEDGNEALDEEDRDLVSRIMKSRAKKDRMPRPA